MNKNAKIKIVFLTQAASVWCSTESVWKAFSKDERCTTQIVQLPFYHKEYNQENIAAYLLQKNISFKYWYDFNLERENPDVVFFQNPYEETRPAEFSVNVIYQYGCRIVYIPYAFEMIKKWPGSNEDYINVISSCDLLKKCWRVFLRSNESKKMYEEYSCRDNKHMVVTGHPKIDFVVNSTISKLDLIKKYDEISNRRVILWNPNIGEFGGEEKWDIHFKILSVIKKYENIVVLFRPHPLQLKKLKNIEQSSDVTFEKFKKKLLELSNIILDDSSDYRESFVLSDGLITCASSLIFEYLATKKPIMYTPQAYEEELNSDGEIVEYLYNATTLIEIEQYFESILHGEDPLKEKRMSIIPQFLYSIDGKNGERIKEHVIDGIERNN